MPIPTLPQDQVDSIIDKARIDVVEFLRSVAEIGADMQKELGRIPDEGFAIPTEYMPMLEELMLSLAKTRVADMHHKVLGTPSTDELAKIILEARGG